MYLEPENEVKQLKALAKELRTMGIRGKVDGSSYVGPKTLEACDLEVALVRMGWKMIRSGMYYTDMTPFDKIDQHTGVLQKDGIEARVRWGNTKSTNPPSLVLREVKD